MDINDARIAGLDSVVTQGSNNPVTSGAVYSAISAIVGGSFEVIIAWNGTSAPIVANIPAVVVVRYNDTDYTGTLVASADTEGKFYLVYSNSDSDQKDIYNEYLVVKDGNTYTWEKVGDTSIDLSGYATKQEVNAKYTKPSTGIPASDIASGVIPAAQVNADWNATSGVAQILNKPTIPAGQIQSDWNQTTTTALDYIKNKPSSLPASDVYNWAKAETKPTYTASEVGLGNVGNFKAVSTVANQGLSSTEQSNARANIGAGTSSFSGSYNDLTNKPTIPTVNNATLTIQKNGTTVNSFTANASSNVTANISVPTKVSELTNDSGYTTNTGTITGITMNGSSKGTSGVVNLGTVLTSHQDISGKADKASITAGTAGTSSATSGSTLAVPYVTMNAQGIVTGYGTHTHTITGFLTSHQDISGKENTSNKVTSVSSSSTDTQYPTAKCLYTMVGNIETLLAAI